MPNRLLKYKNVAPLLENELFVRALSLSSSEQYKEQLTWDEKNRYAGFYPGGAVQSRTMQAAGVLLLSTPAKGDGGGVPGTSANIVKLFEESDTPFVVLGVKCPGDVIDLKNTVVEFGRYKNLEDAARVAIAIHENDAFEIPDCLDEKPEITYPERPAEVKERRDRAYVETMKAEIERLESRILDRKVWLKEARRDLASLDPESTGEQAYYDLLDLSYENPGLREDPETSAKLERLHQIQKLSSNIRLNDLSCRDEQQLLEKTQRRHDTFVERTYGPQIQEPDFYSRVI